MIPWARLEPDPSLSNALFGRRFAWMRDWRETGRPKRARDACLERVVGELVERSAANGTTLVVTGFMVKPYVQGRHGAVFESRCSLDGFL